MFGGVDFNRVAEDAFKYTRSTQRIEWVKRTFPLGAAMIQAVQAMPWSSYSFDGTVRLARYAGNDSEGEPILEFVPRHVSVDAGTYLPYYYFGGCVYEILNTKHASSVPLHDFVDPTGDIDVAIHRPPMTVEYLEEDQPEEPTIQDRMYVIGAGGARQMNEFVDHWTRWVFAEFAKQLKRIPPRIWDAMFGDAVPVTNMEADADIAENVRGNVWLIRKPEMSHNMVKVQLLVQWPGLEADHLVEFVYAVSDAAVGISTSVPSAQIVGDALPVESFQKLIDGNLDSMKRRVPLREKPELQHKFFNHVGRMQYLNRLMPLVVTSRSDTRLAFKIAEFIKYLFGIVKEGHVCQFALPSGSACDRQEILDSLAAGLVPYLFKDTAARYSKRRDVVGSYGFARVGGKQYDIYAIIEELFPTYPLDVGVAGGGKRKRHTRRSKASRSQRGRYRSLRRHRTRRRV